MAGSVVDKAPAPEARALGPHLGSSSVFSSVRGRRWLTSEVSHGVIRPILQAQGNSAGLEDNTNVYTI